MTVPAIWKPAAKQLMREAAYQVSCYDIHIFRDVVLSYGHFLQDVSVTSSSLTILTSSIFTFISGMAGTSLKPRADTDRFGARGGLRLL